MPDVVTSLKLKWIENELKQCCEKYEKVADQILRTLNDADKIPLKANLAQLEKEIAHLEEERNRLKSADSSPKERQNAVSQHLHKIDYTQARKTFASLLRRVDACGGAALFLVEESLC